MASLGSDPVGDSEASVTEAPNSPVPNGAEPYPMRLEVEYREGLSRLSTGFRLFLAIPFLLLAGVVSNLTSVGMTFGWVAVFMRKKYPRWLFEGMQGAYAWQARTLAYVTLLTDEFPTLNASGSPVVLEYDTPPDGELSRWRVLVWKTILLVPTFIVLGFLAVAVFFVTIMAWFAIMFTGRYPRGLFGFTTGVGRWYLRAVGYLASFNDRYPPFAFSRDSGPAANTTVVVCGILGAIAIPIVIVSAVAAVIIANQEDVIEVDYEDLQAGISSEPFCYTGDFSDDPSMCAALLLVDDPASESDLPLLEAESGERFVVFNVAVFTARDGELLRGPAAFSLRYQEDGDDDETAVAPQLVTINGRAEPRHVEEGESEIVVVFLIPEDAEPVSLRFTPPIVPNPGLRFEFD